MLQQLSIKNFALIDKLQVNFTDGFSIITGETGAGKSIIIGALGLILGKRADLSALKDETKKCIVEGEFLIEKYDLTSFFANNDIDYENVTIIRREIAPSGKSRAFINDTPVRLNILNELGEKLFDIHSQHQTLKLADKKFQFQIIDALANTKIQLNEYRLLLEKYTKEKKEYLDLQKMQQESKLQYDYNLFLFKELNEVNVSIDEQEILENTLAKLNNVEAIKSNFEEAITISNNDDLGVKSRFLLFKKNLSSLASYSKEYQDLLDRFLSLQIEFSDIVNELETANENIDVSESDINKYNTRLRLIYDLQKKHGVTSNEELLKIVDDLSIKISNVENGEDIINDKKYSIDLLEQKLDEISNIIHQKRLTIIPDLINRLESMLATLAMPNTRFKIQLTNADTYLKNGKDELNFLFSANRGSNFENLKKVASGGEMSRIMLAVKELLSSHSNLPTILFDEIDTGVSGEVSNRIAAIMSAMSKNMQVIAITHLPQIAAKGDRQFKVYKKDVNQSTITNIKELNEEERVNEIAEMLSGKNLVNSAIQHAKQLLG